MKAISKMTSNPLERQPKLESFSFQPLPTNLIVDQNFVIKSRFKLYVELRLTLQNVFQWYDIPNLNLQTDANFWVRNIALIWDKHLFIACSMLLIAQTFLIFH